MEYILLRYGNRPDQAVSAKLFEYVTPGKKPNFTVLPGVMITAFSSDENIEIIRAGLATLPIAFDLVASQATPTATTGAARTATPASRTAASAVDMTSLPSMKAALQAAVAREDWNKAAELRDAIAALEGPATGTTPTTENPTTERKIITSILEFKKNFKK
jgi:hypothetical protein